MTTAIIACIASTVGVMAALIVHIIKYGEEKGAMRERVKRLEHEMIEQKQLGDTVGELKTSVTVLNNTVTDFKNMLTTVMAVQGPHNISRK